MEKTEYKIKMDQVENLVRQGDLKEAVDVLDTMNYRKIRNVNVLLRASEIAEQAGQPEKGREILEIAHEKSPIARMIIYRLALISVKMGELDEAETYYKEFVDIAPHDGLRFVIRYTLRKAQGADITELIGILEDLCDEDFVDKWAFELACLYRKNGDEQKCIALCDKIALWFGEGPYVEKSLEMKMMYKALTPEQEEQYRRLTRGDTGTSNDKKSDTITIPQVEEKPEKFDTVNLQAEIRKNIEEIMMATETGEVSENMDAIKDLVGDIPYVTAEKPALDKHKASHDEPEQEESKTPIEDSYQQYLAEEYDGQMALNLPSGGDDEQIEGQMTIRDVLDDWGRQQRAMEAALNDAKKKKLAQAKEAALREANQIMDRLVDISPQLEAGVTPEEILKDEYLNKDSEDKSKTETTEEKTGEEKPKATEVYTKKKPETDQSPEEILAGVNDMLQKDIDSMEEGERSEVRGQREEDKGDRGEGIGEREEKGERSEVRGQRDETEAEEKKNPGEPEVDGDLVAKAEEKDKTVLESEVKEEPLVKAEENRKPEVKTEEKKVPENAVDDKTREIHFDVNSLAAQIENTTRDEEKDKVEADYTDDEKAILSYFTRVHGMKTQLLGAINTLKLKCDSDGAIKTGNLTISGPEGSGKTALASKLVQVIQKETEKLSGGAGRITGEMINTKDLNALISKVRGGSLMIEKAGRMNYKTAVSLSLMIENDRSGTLFILEDSEKELQKLAVGTPKLWKYFTEHLAIPEMTIDELVDFGKVYVLENGYSMDDMAILALYDRIGMLQGGSDPVGLKDMKAVIDESIEKYEKRSKGFFSHFSARMTDEEGRPMLQEKDIIE